jgi:hypothetical protein
LGRGASAFKETDLTRALRAIAAAGQPIRGVRFDKSGGFVVLIGKSENNTLTPNAWDEVLDNGDQL